ncbi:MAG: Rieske 2Fe-2S domain-containing protein [Hyphomicrobiales bacterium]|nr:Rieske 2Fe-2S domain-containing protein [Hyphomicrobiales bacterium]
MSTFAPASMSSHEIGDVAAHWNGPRGQWRRVEPRADGHAITVSRIADQFCSADDRCTHGDVSLTEEGTLDGCIVACRFRFGSFNVTTGAPVAMPCEAALEICPVRVENGIVHVEV